MKNNLWVPIQKDSKQVAIERQKARDLRNSNWWKNLISKGICEYCGKVVGSENLTMDHRVPVSRGGKSTKGNIVASCKECNNKKRCFTPAELIIAEMENQNSLNDETLL